LDCLPGEHASQNTHRPFEQADRKPKSKPGFIEWRKPFPVNPSIPIRQTKLHLRKLHWAEYRDAWTAYRKNALVKNNRRPFEQAEGKPNSKPGFLDWRKPPGRSSDLYCLGRFKSTAAPLSTSLVIV
jgi:hypothetical protein